MKVVAPKERRDGETRVAIVPDAARRLISLGLEVAVEAGAGASAGFSDESYAEAGATVVADAAQLFAAGDIVFKVQRPLTANEGAPDELAMMKRGAMLVALLSPYDGAEPAKAYAAAGIDAYAMEWMPRISRAQSMDVLSSQANLAGYRAVIDAAHAFGRAFPLMMTAAGRINPAKAFVMGAGVAGLQAIATARRLGAVVSATDVRPVAKEQVESLGATFVMVESEETRAAETSGGYAREMSAEYQAQQQALIAETISDQDVVITTAAIPGRPAPKLVSEDMVRSMRPGSVIVDLAVETGGNCALSEAGAVVERHGVTIIGHRNVPGRLPADASALYARNLVNFLTSLIDRESGALKINPDDAIVAGTALTRDGQVVHPNYLPKAPSEETHNG
ncbi:MAG: Re/Si-specific NAD(P)(+) transhydrogenase subunit alpha [Alphaproteobacteria bacterium]